MPYQDIDERTLKLVTDEDEIDESTLKPVGIGPPDREPVSKFKGTLPGPMTGPTTPGMLTQGPRIKPIPTLEEIGERQKALRRAAVPTKEQRRRMTPQQRLKQAEVEAELEGRFLPSVRAATPEEAREDQAIATEQEIYDKWGPAAYAIRKGVIQGIKNFPAIAAPVALGEELAALPGDISALFTEGPKELGRRQELRKEIRERPLDRGVVRDAQDPLRL